jgi:hypothetical protein
MRVLALAAKTVATPLSSGRLLLLGTHSNLKSGKLHVVTALWDVRLGESGFHSRTRQGYSSSPHRDQLCYLQSPLSIGYQRLHRGSGDRDVISCNQLHLVPGVSTAITSPFISHEWYRVDNGFVVNVEWIFRRYLCFRWKLLQSYGVTFCFLVRNEYKLTQCGITDFPWRFSCLRSFWDVVRCRLLGGHRSFRTVYLPCPKGSSQMFEEGTNTLSWNVGDQL